MLVLNSTDFYNQFLKKICKTNILKWAGLREVHYIIAKKLWQVSLHNLTNICSGWQHFWCYEREIKGLLHPTHQRKSQTTQFVQKLKSNFHLNSDHLKQIFKLPNSIVVELYVGAFQCKVINSILYTDTKLFKIGFNQSESLTHLFYHCSRSKQFGLNLNYIDALFRINEFVSA